MKNHEALDDTFDITPDVKPSPLSRTRKEVAALAKLSEVKEKDAAYVRAKLYEMSEKLSEAASESLEVALESSHPRAYEVCANTMKACAEVAEKITDLHSKSQKIETDAEIKQQSVVQAGGTQQNIFMTGSTADLMKALKEVNTESK
jgi:precorrin-6x reductase